MFNERLFTLYGDKDMHTGLFFLSNFSAMKTSSFKNRANNQISIAFEAYKNVQYLLYHHIKHSVFPFV